MPLMPVSETPEKVMFCVTGYTRSAAISETRIIFLEKQFANHVLLVKNNKKTITLAGLVSLPELLFCALRYLILRILWASRSAFGVSWRCQALLCGDQRNP